MGRRANTYAGMVLAQVLDSIAVGILLPVVPRLAIELGASAVMVTALVAVQFACGAMSGLVLGRLSDRVSRGGILLGALWAITASYWLHTVTPPLLLLFLLRGVVGFMSSNLLIVESIIAESSTGHEHSAAIAKLRLGSTAGLIIGPGVSGMLSRVHLVEGVQGLVVLAAAVQTLVPLAMLGTLRGLPVASARHSSGPSAYGFVLELFVTNPRIREFALIKSLIAACFALLVAISPVWSEARLGWAADDLSGLISAFGVSLLVVQVAVATNRVRWLTSDNALFIACLIVVPAFLSLMLFPQGGALLACFVAVGLSSAVVNIVVPVSISRITLVNAGTMLGLVYTGVQVGSTLAPLATGATYQRCGGAWTWGVGLTCAISASTLAFRQLGKMRGMAHG